ncbi:UNVERIFIED_CONTAM: hypothetical protein K2H54_007049 [Gekko kuhli]
MPRPCACALSFSGSCLSFGGKLADPDGRTVEFPMSLESGDGVGRGGPEFWRPHLQRRRSDQQLTNHPRGLCQGPPSEEGVLSMMPLTEGAAEVEARDSSLREHPPREPRTPRKRNGEPDEGALQSKEGNKEDPEVIAKQEWLARTWDGWGSEEDANAGAEPEGSASLWGGGSLPGIE